ncbi:MAG TPA: hypothetical protein VJT33_03460 [bacterium]|nr:hypothetical protein [bacterium]
MRRDRNAAELANDGHWLRKVHRERVRILEALSEETLEVQLLTIERIGDVAVDETTHAVGVARR